MYVFLGGHQRTSDNSHLLLHTDEFVGPNETVCALRSSIEPYPLRMPAPGGGSLPRRESLKADEMRSMDPDVRAALSLAQARARSLGAATFDVAHVTWALAHPGDESSDDSTPGYSPEMLPFSKELEKLFSGPLERTVTMPELQLLAQDC